LIARAAEWAISLATSEGGIDVLDVPEDQQDQEDLPPAQGDIIVEDDGTSVPVPLPDPDADGEDPEYVAISTESTSTPDDIG